MLPLSRKERTKYIFEILKAGKCRWDWNIDVVCQLTDQKPFEDLVAPSGRLFTPPHLLKVAPWERDTATSAEVSRRIAEAESMTDIPLGRAILAGGHGIGRAFNAPFRFQPGYAIVRKTFKDNMEPFRILRRLFEFADRTLEQSAPDFVFAFDWATPQHFTMWLAATRRGIPCVSIRNSKINHDHAYWTLDRLMLNTAALENAAARRSAGACPSPEALEYVRDFREKPRMINYIAVKWQDRTNRNFFKWHVIQVRRVVREALNTLRNQDRALREPATSLFLRYYRSLYLTWRHQHFLHTLDNETLARERYVYFPMHKEAELAQTLQATNWQDQRNTIRLIASLLPSGYRLLVREHRFNYGNRPTRFYKQLSKIPNVVPVDPFDSQFRYLSQADLVITENGSSGWEGLLLGKRVITLARNFYDGTGLGTKVLNTERLNAVILDVLAKTPVNDPERHDEALATMIEAEREHTFPSTVDGTDQALKLLAQTMAPALNPSTTGGAMAIAARQTLQQEVR